MKCSICGRTALRSTQLCTGCTAAIQRAQDATIRKMDLLVAPTARTIHASLSSADAHLPGATPLAAGGSGIRAHWVTLTASLALFSMIAVPTNWHSSASRFERTIDPMSVARAAMVERPAEAAPAMRREPAITVERSATLASRPDAKGASTTRKIPASELRLGNPSPSHLTAASHQALRTGHSSRPSIAMAHASTSKERGRVKDGKQVAARPAPTPPVTDEHAAAAPRVVQTASAGIAPPPAPAIPSSLSLNQALARCAAQSILSRTWCEHTARTRYCEGKSGERAECAVEVSSDHGG